MSPLRAAVALSLLAAATGAQEPEEPADPGYRVTGRRVVVEGAEQWAAWQVPEGAAVLGEDGFWVELHTVNFHLLMTQSHDHSIFRFSGDFETIRKSFTLHYQ